MPFGFWQAELAAEGGFMDLYKKIAQKVYIVTKLNKLR